MSRMPDFAVIGAQKSASTYLADLLGARSDVTVPRLEIPYFEAPFFDTTPVEEMERVGEDVPAEDVYGIKRADYLCRPEVPGNMARLVPNVRIIAVLRPPVQRAISGAYWYMLHGKLPVRPLEETIETVLDEWSDTRAGQQSDVLAFGRYATALARWETSFANDQVLVLDSRTLSTADVRTSLVEHLRLSDGSEASWSAASSIRSNPGVYDPVRLRVLRLRVPLVYDWSKADRFHYRSRPWSYRPIRTTLARAPMLLDRWLVQPVRERKPETKRPAELSESLLNRLDAFFEDEIAQVRSRYGIDLQRMDEAVK